MRRVKPGHDGRPFAERRQALFAGLERARPLNELSPCSSARNDWSPQPASTGLRVGVLANPASVDHNFQHLADLLAPLESPQGHRHLRAAARLQLGPPGQHDRDAARQGPAAQHADLLAL